jgi:tRNA modification GTPase
MNNSGIGIIRISGENSFEIAKKIFKPARKEKDIFTQPSHTVHYWSIVEDEQILDEVLLLLMKAPHTYTREDTVEIDCHGGVFVVKKNSGMVLKSGARPAEPERITKRAFLNGRIDLSQAEAVMI